MIRMIFFWGGMATIGLGLLGCGQKPEADPEPAERPAPVELSFDFDSWDCWNQFDEGAWVFFEGEEKSGRKFTEKKILREKNGGRITGVVELNGILLDQTLADNSTPRKVSSLDGVRIEWRRENLQVGDKELLCDVKLSQKSGEGTEEWSEVWYNRSVPGWVVKRVNARIIKVCTGYGGR